MRPANRYKTCFGLYNATLRALKTLDGCKRGWWIQNAVTHARTFARESHHYLSRFFERDVK